MHFVKVCGRSIKSTAGRTRYTDRKRPGALKTNNLLHFFLHETEVCETVMRLKQQLNKERSRASTLMEKRISFRYALLAQNHKKQDINRLMLRTCSTKCHLTYCIRRHSAIEPPHIPYMS